ncbi:MAG: hypothetical protein ACYTDX_01930 [Planctomycetota bacterium]|jgi:hypothetical protein
MGHRGRALRGLGAFAAGLAALWFVPGIGLSPIDPVFAQEEERVMAPELVGAEGWVGVEKPLTLEDLRGKVVLLDFWTYG